jgi:uncharacterized membrane protein
VKVLVFGVAFLSAVLTALTQPTKHRDTGLVLVAVGGFAMVLYALFSGGVL